jgi:polar amino acid transport system substrate-binding protein
MERMKEHPKIGAKMVEHVQRFEEIASWIRHHHEHYDGSGYPMGLKGTEIPLPSRITSMTR